MDGEAVQAEGLNLERAGPVHVLRLRDVSRPLTVAAETGGEAPRTSPDLNQFPTVPS